MSVTSRITRRSGAAALAAAALVFALAACAPSAANVPSGGTSGGASGGTSGGGESISLTDWQLKWSQCMRDEGIDMPDPSADGGGIAISIDGTNMEALDAASAACSEELGDPPPMSAEERKAADQAMLEWARKAAQCYRDAGYDMADPKAGEAPRFPTDASEEVMAECGSGAATTVQK